MLLTDFIHELSVRFADLQIINTNLDMTITEVTLIKHDVPQVRADHLYLDVRPHKLALNVYIAGSWQRVAELPARGVKLERLALALMATAGQILRGDEQLHADELYLATHAIAADFAATLNKAAHMLKAPLMVIDLLGQHIIASSINAPSQGSAIGQYLADHIPALTPGDFWQHLYLTDSKISLTPLLLSPMAAGGDAIGYLAFPLLGDGMTATQVRQLAAFTPIISQAAAKGQFSSISGQGRGRLLTMMLTAFDDSTFEAQFAREHVQLPHGMVLLEALSKTGRTSSELSERLIYLLTPLCKQVIATSYHHHAVALISLDINAYNDGTLKHTLQQLAEQLECQFIVSHYYERARDTPNVYKICRQVSQLRTISEDVNFCEDQFFALMLAKLPQWETVLPLFLNPSFTAIAAYDAQNCTELLPTLRAYLEATCNLTATAHALYIHPNTLRARMQRINEISGLDIKDADVCFKLAASFAVQHFLNAYQIEPDGVTH